MTIQIKYLSTSILTLGIIVSGSATSEYHAKVRSEIGVLEERYGAGSMEDREDRHRLGVRPLFYWDRDHWVSFQTLFDVPNYNEEKRESSEFAARRVWHFSSKLSEGTVESEANPVLPYNIWMAVQPIVRGEEFIPEATRTIEFAGWVGEAVRPPVAVSTLRGFPVKAKLPEPVVLTVEEIPIAVVKAGREQLLQQHARWNKGVEPPVPPADEGEIQSFLKNAKKYSIDSEKTAFYAFCHEGEDDWVGLLAPVVCEDQVTYEAWPLRDSLTFIGGGDFNLDGAWEYLFWIDGYNENGYLLASEKFRRVVSYSWSYH